MSTGRSGDRGSASVEFTVLAVFLLIPLVYVMLAVFAVQGASYGLSSAVREAGRAYVTAGPGADPGTRAYVAASIALSDHGYALGPGDVPAPVCTDSPCLTPGGTVTFTISYDVPLPLLPERVFGRQLTSVRVTASHAEYVDRFRVRA